MKAMAVKERSGNHKTKGLEDNVTHSMRHSLSLQKNCSTDSAD